MNNDNTQLISVCGHLCNDYILNVDEYPEVGTSCRLINREYYYGGGAANIAVGIAKLGGQAELIVAVGKDYIGSQYESYLNSIPGLTTRFYNTDTFNCSTAYMINNSKGDQVTYFEKGAASILSEIDPPNLSFVHMATGNEIFNFNVSQKSEFASFDPGQDVKYYSSNSLSEILDNVNMVICNRIEATIMCRILGCNIQDIISRVPIVILTAGKNGSTLYYNNDTIEIPACPSTQIDPTGAGDAYLSGWFTAYKKGYSLPVCCQIGSVTASFAIEQIGSQTNLSNWDQMADRYSDTFGTLKKSE
ncbi:MAG TPA: carbohydrate kinase family protein [Methanocorpusculum sp.]|nr:carbohydrate kinase family protein [Methanocorpusculum sp.]